jgi:hypothetical protein
MTMRTIARVVILGLACCFTILGLRADEVPVPLDKVPKAVLEAVKTRFPKGELKEASKETEGDKTSYEVSVKQDGKNIDVTLTPAGVITLIEKEIAAKDVPAAVMATMNREYAKATYKIIEEVIKVQNGKETLDFYEFHGTTADGKTLEVEVLPDGKIKK